MSRKDAMYAMMANDEDESVISFHTILVSGHTCADVHDNCSSEAR